MKIIKQYLQAVSKHLPYKERQDIIDELNVLIHDKLDEMYQKPTQKQVEEYLTNFGSPRAVAKRFTGEKHLIAPHFTDLFILIAKIIVLAMSIAFTVVFVLELFDPNLEVGNIFTGLVKLPLNILQASV